jgi:signal transduction histidine kinase
MKLPIPQFVRELLSDALSSAGLTVKLPKELEEEFWQDYARKSLWQARVALVLTAGLWAVFVLVDDLVLPEHKSFLWLIRFGVEVPFLLLVFLFSFSRYFERVMQPVMLTTYFVIGFGLIALQMVGPPLKSHPFSAGLLFAVPYGYLLLRLRFMSAFWVSLVITIAYNMMAIWRDTPLEILINNNFFLATTNIMGLLGGYYIEGYLRRDFLQRRAAEKSVEQLNALREVGQSVGSTLDLDTVLTTIVTHAAELSGASGGVIYEYDEATQAFHFRTSHHVEEELIEALRAGPIPRDQGAVGEAAAMRKPIEIPDILAQPGSVLPRVRPILADLGYRSLLAVPLLREQRIMGGLVVWRRQTGSFSAEIVNLLQTFAIQSGLAIQNARLFREIDDKSRQLESANLAKSRFLAAASHDLRQPLHALGLFVAQLRGSPDAAERGQLVGRIDAAVAAMSELFNALLDVAKLDAGVLTPDRTDFPIAHLLDRVETTFAEAAREKGLRLRIMPNSAWVRSDSILLERILLNLLSNAVRYTTRGGVLIGCRRRGDALRIEVWDSGPGIPEDQRRNIFGEFIQLAGSGRDRHAGLGLGLAIVERLCRLLDHAIELTSTIGKGSRFTVVVPLVAAAARIVETPAAPELVPDSASGKLVVVVDDDAMALAAMGGVLASWGCRVVMADSDRDALAGLAAHDRPPDLIISDYRLADGNNGIEVIERLRKEFRASIPAFLVSGDTARERLLDVRARGYHLLHKPVPPLALRAMLRRLLKKAGSERGRPTDVVAAG